MVARPALRGFFRRHPEADNMLREKWRDSGIKSEQIARDLHDRFGEKITANAVIGRAHRLELPIRSSLAVYVKPVPRPRDTPAMRALDKECPWPIGFPGSSDYRSCGAPTDGVYCARHEAMAHPKKRTVGEHHGDAS